MDCEETIVSLFIRFSLLKYDQLLWQLKHRPLPLKRKRPKPPLLKGMSSQKLTRSQQPRQHHEFMQELIESILLEAVDSCDFITRVRFEQWDEDN
ncbi:hypothetical protein chiPu_0009831 [Chiloscyllium punctatum]|uniref:Uncharacterized protein n=1 Tax=Chiloscyllium punctatum TaxID=137246 RepID=A0A401SLV1_CHIPU|nr:hypothetical protein [Chiloscyllium punctatum]